MKINPSIFKAYDIRAVYGSDIDAEGWADVVRGTYNYFLTKTGKTTLIVNVSRDMREGSEAFYDLTLNTLKDLGATVRSLGLTSTPVAYFALGNLKSDAGMLITASHNPAGYTGLKCILRDGEKVIKVPGTDLKSFAIDKNFSAPMAGGTIETAENQSDITAQKTLTELPQITKKFKVVVDTANGMGITYIKALEKLLPLEITYLYSDLDGNFPNHLSDTLQHSYWTKLCEKVKETKADFGIATDGDADRIAFVDETGRFLPNTLITSLVMDVLHETKGSNLFLVDIRSILNARNFAKKIDSRIEPTKVGHAFITKQMQDTGAEFGGESSGHYYFKNTGGAENPIYVILAVLLKLQETGKTMSASTAMYESAFEAVEHNFVVPATLSKETIFDKVKSQYADSQIDLLDGITVNYASWRANIRTSNTEPLLRLNCEAESKAELDAKLAELTSFLTGLGATAKSGH